MPRTPEEIAREARDAISQFCVEECQAYCCRKGYLLMSKEEAELVCRGRVDEMIQKKILKRLPYGEYSLFLGNPDGCPSLDGSKCRIHKNPLRPKTCERFPIFIDGKNIRLSNRCLAVKQGKLYPYEAEFLSNGYKIIEMEEKNR